MTRPSITAIREPTLGWCFFLLADVGDCRVEIRPEGLDASHVLSLAKNLILHSLLVCLVVDVRRKLFLVDIVSDSVDNLGILARLGRVRRPHLKRRLFYRAEATTMLLTL